MRKGHAALWYGIKLMFESSLSSLKQVVFWQGLQCNCKSRFEGPVPDSATTVLPSVITGDLPRGWISHSSLGARIVVGLRLYCLTCHPVCKSNNAWRSIGRFTGCADSLERQHMLHHGPERQLER